MSRSDARIEPASTGGDRKSRVLRVRLGATEHEMLEEMAQVLEVSTSSLVRKMIRETWEESKR